jgi:hypothetical protein
MVMERSSNGKEQVEEQIAENYNNRRIITTR